jgi:hypothetical protein
LPVTDRAGRAAATARTGAVSGETYEPSKGEPGRLLPIITFLKAA